MPSPLQEQDGETPTQSKTNRGKSARQSWEPSRNKIADLPGAAYRSDRICRSWRPDGVFNRVRERPEAKLMGLPDCGILALRYLAPGGGTHADDFSTLRHSEKRRRWRIHARGGRERLAIGEGAHHRAVSALSGAIRGCQPNYRKDCRQRDYRVELPAASRPERSRRAVRCPWRLGGASGWWVRHVLAVI